MNRRCRLVGLTILVGAITTVVVIMSGVPVEAAEVAAPPADLNTVINNITKWLVGLLVSLATLFLTIGGIRRLTSGGDPGEVAKANEAFKNAALGYGVAVLAPLLVTILKGFVGG